MAVVKAWYLNILESPYKEQSNYDTRTQKPMGNVWSKLSDKVSSTNLKIWEARAPTATRSVCGHP